MDRHTSIPDPSSATTQMILREIGALKELFESTKQYRTAEITALKDLMTTRIVAVEESIKLAHENEARWPTVLDREITGVKEFFGVLLGTHNEKFISVNRRFEERDRHVLIDSGNSKTAIDAAFKAANEAVAMQRDASDKAINKSEAAFTKQIEGAASALVTAKTELDKRLEDAKERMNGMSAAVTTQMNQMQQAITAMQAAQVGRKELTVEKNDNTHLVYGAIGLVLGLGGLVAAFLARTAS